MDKVPKQKVISFKVRSRKNKLSHQLGVHIKSHEILVIENLNFTPLVGGSATFVIRAVHLRIKLVEKVGAVKTSILSLAGLGGIIATASGCSAAKARFGARRHSTDRV